MKKKTKENKSLEIIVSTYWPTKIIKSIKVNDPNIDSAFYNKMTFTKEQAIYVRDQLNQILESKETKEDGKANKV